MATHPDPMCDRAGAACAGDVDRIVARIDGALGATLLVELDCLRVCRCHGRAPDAPTPRAPWSYADLKGVSIGQYGPMPVVLLDLVHRPDPLPILLLERGQVNAALDGLVALRRLISDSRRPAASADLALVLA